MSTAWSATNKNSDFVVSNGGLTVSTSVPVGAYSNGQADVAITTGDKKFCEVTVDGASSQVALGASNASMTYGYGRWLGEDADSCGYYVDSNVYAAGGSLHAVYATYTAGDVIGMAFDFDAGTIEYFKNGTSQGTFTHGITGDIFPAYLLQYNGTTLCQLTANFGATSWAYPSSVPSGFTGFDSGTFTPTPGTFGYDLFGEEYYSARVQDQNVGPLIIAASSFAEFGQVIHTAAMAIANVGSTFVMSAAGRIRTLAIVISALSSAIFAGIKFWEPTPPGGDPWRKQNPGTNPWTTDSAGSDPWTEQK